MLKTGWEEMKDNIPAQELHPDQCADAGTHIPRSLAAWELIETAPKDGTVIIGKSFGPRGFIDYVWWQPEFDSWIAGAREMVTAFGYTFDDGSTRRLHSPERRSPTHWMPEPVLVAARDMGSRVAAQVEGEGSREHINPPSNLSGEAG